MDRCRELKAALQDYAPPLKGLHGAAHWARVLENGWRPAEEIREDDRVHPARANRNPKRKRGRVAKATRAGVWVAGAPSLDNASGFERTNRHAATWIGWMAAALLVLNNIERTHGEDPASANAKPDASTLHGKVLCGYQGWFRCPDDGTNEGWLHWSRDRERVTPQSVTVEMWPDTSEFGAEERYPVPGFTSSDGQAACLFSSAHPRTVERHFEWMREYGIDGVFLQRFLVNLRKPSFDEVLKHARSSAERTGRVYAVCYDLSGARQARMYDQLVNDWKRLVDESRITADNRYLRHNGKPVLFVWGFFSERFSAALAHRIIDFFKADGPYGVTLVGGCPWYWRRERDREWSRAFRRFDVISPWNVGNYTLVDGNKVADTGYWDDDLSEARQCGIEYLPVLYPGFGWTNLMGKDAERVTIPRRGGEFFWEQFVAAAERKLDMAYVAMYDEVDEATAIFKVSNSPPTQARFQTLEGLPTDWYLRLTGEGTRLLRGERAAGREMTTRP